MYLGIAHPLFSPSILLQLRHWRRICRVPHEGQLLAESAICSSLIVFFLQAMSEPMFYFTALLTIVVLMLPILAWRFYWVDVYPTLSDKVRYKQRMDEKRAAKRSERRMVRTPSARRSRRSLRSGYAFAHQEGFGRLITSGKIMKPRKQMFRNGSNGPPGASVGKIMVAPAPIADVGV